LRSSSEPIEVVEDENCLVAFLPGTAMISLKQKKKLNK
jgi:hypothetical protein